VQSVSCGVHWPPALHLGSVSVDAEQVVVPQLVPAGYVAHCPLPLQTPVVPQVEAGMVMHAIWGSSPPSGTGWQVPCMFMTAHERQLGQLAAAQQKPSVQLVLKHSVPEVQAAPFALRLVQAFDMQVNPLAQSPSPLQVVRHSSAPQANGAQPMGDWSQEPAPLQ
jgi:hypothetical protein